MKAPQHKFADINYNKRFILTAAIFLVKIKLLKGHRRGLKFAIKPVQYGRMTSLYAVQPAGHWQKKKPLL